MNNADKTAELQAYEQAQKAIQQQYDNWAFNRPFYSEWDNTEAERLYSELEVKYYALSPEEQNATHEYDRMPVRSHHLKYFQVFKANGAIGLQLYQTQAPKWLSPTNPTLAKLWIDLPTEQREHYHQQEQALQAAIERILGVSRNPYSGKTIIAKADGSLFVNGITGVNETISQATASIKPLLIGYLHCYQFTADKCFGVGIYYKLRKSIPDIANSTSLDRHNFYEDNGSYSGFSYSIQSLAMYYWREAAMPQTIEVYSLYLDDRRKADLEGLEPPKPPQLADYQFTAPDSPIQFWNKAFLFVNGVYRFRPTLLRHYISANEPRGTQDAVLDDFRRQYDAAGGNFLAHLSKELINATTFYPKCKPKGNEPAEPAQAEALASLEKWIAERQAIPEIEDTKTDPKRQASLQAVAVFFHCLAKEYELGSTTSNNSAYAMLIERLTGFSQNTLRKWLPNPAANPKRTKTTVADKKALNKVKAELCELLDGIGAQRLSKSISDFE